MSKPPNSSWNFTIIKEQLTDAEKDRILALYFNSDITNTNTDKAATDLKSASYESVKVSLRNTFKKLEKAGAKIGVTAAAPGTPKTPRGSAGKKRKGKVEMEMEGGGAMPSRKKGRKGKKAGREDDGDGDDEEEEERVKEEQVSDEV